ncbi:MAG: hypothetical protein QXJ51_05875 [Sulfolobales archaeon]
MSRKVHYLDLEGMALNGLIRKSIMQDCSDSKIRKSKIIVETVSGESIETDCIEYERLVRVWIVIKHYEKWNKNLVEKVSEEILKREEIDT